MTATVSAPPVVTQIEMPTTDPIPSLPSRVLTAISTWTAPIRDGIERIHRKVENLTSRLPSPLNKITLSLYQSLPFLAIQFIPSWPLYLTAMGCAVVFQLITSQNFKPLLHGLAWRRLWLVGQGITEAITKKALEPFAFALTNVLIALTLFSDPSRVEKKPSEQQSSQPVTT